MSSNKKRSFLMKFKWVRMLVLFIGIILLGVALFIQFGPLKPEDITYTVNGVLKPSSEETLKQFKLIFLSVFGSIGLINIFVAIFLIIKNRLKQRKNEYLKENGVRISAKVLELEPSIIRYSSAPTMNYNRKHLSRLKCVWDSYDGNSYIFKSDLLRVDPIPYLEDGQVVVYYNQNKIHEYFVDIDGSIGLNDRLIEL